MPLDALIFLKSLTSRMSQSGDETISAEEAQRRLKVLDKATTPIVKHPVHLVQKTSKDLRSGELGHTCPADSLLLSIPTVLPHLKFTEDESDPTKMTYFYQQSLVDLDVSFLLFFVIVFNFDRLVLLIL